MAERDPNLLAPMWRVTVTSAGWPPDLPATLAAHGVRAGDSGHATGMASWLELTFRLDTDDAAAAALHINDALEGVEYEITQGPVRLGL